MRRKDREITDRNEILEILSRADVCRLALTDEGAPYIVPMNFGFAQEEDGLNLYFHCAREGKKLDLIRRDGRAAFEVDFAPAIIRGEGVICNASTAYQSVCGSGTIQILPPDETERALGIVISHYTKEKGEFGPNRLRATVTLRLHVSEITGKRSIARE